MIDTKQIRESVAKICQKFGEEYWRDLDKKKEATEMNLLRTKLKGLNENDKKTIKAMTKDLETRQDSQDDESLLPRVKLTDIKKEKLYPKYISKSNKSCRIFP